MLSWVNRFNICCFLDNHQYSSSHQSVECLAAAGAVSIFSPKDNIFTSLQELFRNNQDWFFGHFAYDLKNAVAPLHSSHPDHIGFPDIFFFQPETVLQLSGNQLTISTLQENPEQIFEEICSLPFGPVSESSSLAIEPRMAKEDYLHKIESIRQHIQRGDCYEINFCQEFYATNAQIDPLSVYRQLTDISPNPFACFYKLDDKYVLCASPERYLQKKGNRLLSQPIKGTFKRNLADAVADESLKQALTKSEKDRSENVMVVDLVRNDLSQVCKEGSVQVDELFGVYSFPQVHQMISTISGELKTGFGLAEILQASFPMGSMTGAPKISAMKIIEDLEATKRGLYSGAIGYLTPDNDFDFNVVIRSILYNAENEYLSFSVGSAITSQAVPEQEYEECLLKAKAMFEVLS